MSATLSSDHIAQLGRLARLKLTDEQQQRFAEQLSGVLGGLVDQLQEVATEHVSAAADASGKRTVLAADKLRDEASLTNVSQADLLAGTPAHTADGYIVVRSVMEETAGGA